VAQGTREDISGPAVSGALEEAGWTVQSAETVPDDFNLLRERLEALAANIDVDVVFTTGGTGVGPRDRTPEATTSVMERSLAGVAEVMRREGIKKTPLAALSRGVVGVRGSTLLVNLPGAPEGAEDSLKAVLDILPHAVDVLRGGVVHAAAPEAAPEPAPEAEAEPVQETSPESEPPVEPPEPEESAAGTEENPAPPPEAETKPEPPTGE
jgi:molybdenum cofactor synthesis domain-containing protein